VNLADLNPPQQQAAKLIDRPCLVLAGAGSGKTRVITYKIGYLIRKAGLSPKRIRAVTFTNKAAREMKERISGLLDKAEIRGLKVSTFHTLGLQMLQRDYAHLGYRSGFSIFDGRDSEDLIASLLKDDAVDKEVVQQARHQISRWKNDFLNPEQALKAAENPQQQHQAKLYAHYQEHLQACNAMDFDDLIMLPVCLLQQHTERREYWQNQIHYLLIDEYQDTNNSQYELVRLLVQHRQALTVVGDDDQSIYAWRGARPENLQRLQKDFARLEVIKLEQNYRSFARILKAANSLIANNPHVFEKQLWCDRGAGDQLRVLSCHTADDEAIRVTTDLITRHLQNRAKYRDFAILYRGNFQSRLYEKALREHHVPYQITGSTAFFERTEIKDVMAYLRLLVNPDDDQAYLRVINTPKRKIGSSTLKTLGEYAQQRNVHLLAASQELGLAQNLSEAVVYRLRHFADWLSELSQQIEECDAMALLRRLLSEIAYQQYLQDTSSSVKQAEARWENVEELVSWIGNLQKQNDEPGLAGLVSHLTLMSILENNEEKNEQDAVQLMTLHSAKGLEFEHVYLVGFEEGSIPHHQCLEDDAVLEERRLAYVGITRACRTLCFSYCGTRQRYGEIEQCEPSRFLNELPKEDLQWEGHQVETSEEERKEQGQAHLASIKALLQSKA